ncbi:MAG TPA: hypothetical protein VMW10_10135 [Alphaproteobacteria bacterium]|nr:hypothetical protein [Alphaproteobacteria bacterium]
MNFPVQTTWLTGNEVALTELDETTLTKRVSKHVDMMRVVRQTKQKIKMNMNLLTHDG